MCCDVAVVVNVAGGLILAKYCGGPAPDGGLLPFQWHVIGIHVGALTPAASVEVLKLRVKIPNRPRPSKELISLISSHQKTRTLTKSDLSVLITTTGIRLALPVTHPHSSPSRSTLPRHSFRLLL